MRRRKVDLPEPEGPTRHSTSPGMTRSEIDFSTSLVPKDFETPTASTMGVTVAAAAGAAVADASVMSGTSAFSGRGRDDDVRLVGADDGERTRRRERLGLRTAVAALADSTSEPLLEEVLADHQDGREEQVPERGDDQHRHRIERLSRDVTRPVVEIE